MPARSCPGGVDALAQALDPIIHQEVRLRLLMHLFRDREATATWLRDTLHLTDGNLGSHADRLASAGYIIQRKALTPRGFELRYSITPAGDVAFQAYLRNLRGLLEGIDRPSSGRGS